MIPGTSSPGIISLGCAPRAALYDVVQTSGAVAPSTASTVPLFNRTTANILNLPFLREHLGRPGGMDYFEVTWRPTDNRDFEFTDGDNAVILYTGANAQAFYNSSVTSTNVLDTQGSFLVACGSSMPTNTQVFYEIILNIECTNSTDGASVEVDSAALPCVADQSSFPTMESLYRKVAPLLPSVDTVVGAAVNAGVGIFQSRMRNHHQSRLAIEPSGYTFI